MLSTTCPLRPGEGWAITCRCADDRALDRLASEDDGVAVLNYFNPLSPRAVYTEAGQCYGVDLPDAGSELPA